MRWAVLTHALLLMSCQLVTQLDQLKDEVSVADASSARDAALRDSGVDAAVPKRTACPLAGTGTACNPVKQCGCAEDQHCQVDIRELQPACVPRGDHAANSGCRESRECPAGQTCDRGSCRSYCDSDSDCDDGACLPAQGPDQKLIESLRVCWKHCDPDAADSCAEGTACRRTKTPYATTDTFCVAPFDPCPTIEDGVCNEAKGTGSCAPGSDEKDCACAPQLRLAGASCDPIAQCGCGSEQSCVPVRETGASNASSARCEAYGHKQRYAACAASADCALGFSCDPGLGMCVNACLSDDDCIDGACSKDPGSGASAIGMCRPACNRQTNAPCGGDSVCARFGEHSPLASIRAGDFCWVPLDRECPMNTVCDEPEGTRLCQEGKDDRDCCTPPSPEGECEPVSQCGCASEPETQCRHLAFSTTTQCVPRGHAEPWSHCDGLESDCPPGYACGNSVCRKYCAKHEDCGSAGNMCVPFNDRALAALPGIGACFIACDFAQQGPCPANLVCARATTDLSFCMEPLDPCPSEYVNNGTCDDTGEGGTRLCALGTDPDCAR